MAAGAVEHRACILCSELFGSNSPSEFCYLVIVNRDIYGGVEPFELSPILSSGLG